MNTVSPPAPVNRKGAWPFTAGGGWEPSPPLRLLGLGVTAIVWWRAVERWRTVYSWASHAVSSGYDLRFSWLAERALTHHHAPYAVHGFVYPPSELIVMLPLAPFGFTTVKHWGLIIVLGAMIATVVLSAKIIGRRAWGLTAAVGVLLLASAQPAGNEMVLENLSALMAFGLAAVLLLASRGRWNEAGAVLGLTLAIKPLLIVVVVVFLLARKWRALALVIGIPVVLNAIALVVARDITAASLWSITRTLLDAQNLGHELNASLLGVGALTGLPAVAIWVVRVAAGLIALVAVWWSWRWSRDLPSRLVNTTGALLVGAYLAGSVTEDHYMLTLIPLAVACSSLRSPMRWPLAWIGVAWIMGNYTVWTFGQSTLGALTINRCIGLGLLLITLAAGMPIERLLARRAHLDDAGALARRWPSAAAHAQGAKP